MKTELDTEEETKIFEATETDDGMHALSPNTTLCNVRLSDDDNIQPLETLFESITTIDSEFCDPPPILEQKPSSLFSDVTPKLIEVTTDFNENLPTPVIKEIGTQTTDEFEKPDKEDFSVLQPPLNLGVKNVKQILTCIQSGSLEVQDVIFNECNIIYECKVCHNLFRCLANLLSHKRIYCKDSYAKVYDAYKKQTQPDVTMIIEPESPPEIEEEDVDIEVEDSIPRPQTEIQISTPKIYAPVSESRTFNLEVREEDEDQDETFIHLEPVKENPNAVYQTVIDVTDKMDDSLSLLEETENKDADTPITIPANSTVLLAREDKLMKRSDCDVKNLTCLKCSVTFDKLKSLYIHMKTTHPSKKIYYPCIYCKATFNRMYGVDRHLMSFHKKSKEQVSRVRDLIKKRAFVCKRPLLSEEVRSNKEPKTETVPAPKLHPCSKCNRHFERKSSQISHEKFCRFGGAETKPLVTVSHKKQKELVTPGAVAHHRCIKCGRTFKLKSSQISHSKFCKVSVSQKSSPKEKGNAVSPPAKPLPPKPRVVVFKEVTQEESSRPKRDVKKKDMSKDFVSSQSLKWRSANKVEAVSAPNPIIVKPNADGIVSKVQSPIKRSPESIVKKISNEPNLSHDNKAATQGKSPLQGKTAQQIKMSKPKTSPDNKSPVTAKSITPDRSAGLQMKSLQHPTNLPVNVIEGRMYSIINAQKLSCLKCSRKFSTFSNLRRHAATHIGWMRFRCKHCTYQCFNRSDCRSHIQRMHPDTYTSVANIDRNIIKLSTGKLTVRRGDLMPDATGKVTTKAPLRQETVSKTEIQCIKFPKPVSSIVLKSGPPNISVVNTSPLTSKPVTKHFKEDLEVKPAKPVTSLVLKTSTSGTQAESTSPRVIKSSARKSTGGVPKKILSARKSTGGVPKKIIKSSARKSTGGVSKKLLKTRHISSSPPEASMLRKKPSTTINTSSPPSPKQLLRRKSSSPSLGNSLEFTYPPRTIKSEFSLGASSSEHFPKVINLLRPPRKGDVFPESSGLDAFPKIISMVKSSRKSVTSSANAVLESHVKVINVMKPPKKGETSSETGLETPTKTSKKDDANADFNLGETPSNALHILKTSKVVRVDTNTATTKPHVILLNSSKSGRTENPDVSVLSPKTTADKTDSAITTLVTRGGIYAKPNFKIQVKSNVKQRNSQSTSNCLEANGSPNSELLDHQYT